MSASFNQVTTANLSPDMAIADTTPGEIVLVDSAKKSTIKTTLPAHLLFAVVLIAPLIFLGAIAAVLITKTIKTALQSLSASQWISRRCCRVQPNESIRGVTPPLDHFSLNSLHPPTLQKKTTFSRHFPIDIHLRSMSEYLFLVDTFPNRSKQKG